MVYENAYVKIRVSKVSFWYDKWLGSSHLAYMNSRLTTHPQLSIQKYWEDDKWKEEDLIYKVGTKIN